MSKSSIFRQVLLDKAAEMSECPTASEKIFCSRLEQRRLRFWPQVVVGFYIADIILPERMLIIEIDGQFHKQYKHAKRDWARTKWLESLGFTVKRISNTNAATFDLYRITQFPHTATVEDCQRAIAKANLIRDRAVEREEFAPGEFFLTDQNVQAAFATPDADEMAMHLDLAIFYDQS